MSLDLPHNYLNYSHCSFIQCIEKIHQHLSFLSHFPNNQSKNKTKDDQAQHIDAVRIHAHCFVFLGFVLQFRFKRKKLQPENTEITLKSYKRKMHLDLSLTESSSPATLFLFWQCQAVTFRNEGRTELFLKALYFKPMQGSDQTLAADTVSLNLYCPFQRLLTQSTARSRYLQSCLQYTLKTYSILWRTKHSRCRILVVISEQLECSHLDLRYVVHCVRTKTTVLSFASSLKSIAQLK